MSLQLPLTLGRKANTDFASYVPGANGEALEYLCRLPENPKGPGVYLWGDSGTGKSHLLQAICHAAGARGAAAAYLPMQAADQFPCEVLDGLEDVGLVCIDDIHAIAGRHAWESAFVGLFERIRRNGGSLVITGAALPADLGLNLPQLVSRLMGGLMFQLQPLDEANKLTALQLRAARRGLELSPEVGRYLVRHYGRDTTTLFAALDILDRASLVAQRRLTIPFVRLTIKEADLGADTTL